MSVDTSGGHPKMDYDEHIRTYNGFWLFTKITIVATAVTLIGMAYFLL